MGRDITQLALLRLRVIMTKARHVMVALSAACLIGTVNANPVLDNVASGDVTVQQSGNVTQVQQNSQNAIVNWHSFNIGAGEHTHFQQPTGGVILNRIDPSQGASQIFGKLTATGKVILVNQAGIYFGSGATVNVGGLIASTSDISNANFLSGNYIFDKPSSYSGSIINRGTIIAAQNGLVALVGTSVSNEGMIQANLGHVVLASGNKFTVDLAGDQLINFTVDEGATSAGVSPVDGSRLKNGVSNTGTLIANGGRILVSAKAASGILDKVVNMQGVAVAQSVSEKNGEIILAAEGGDAAVYVGGTLDASGKAANETGGKVVIASKRILIEKTAKIDVSGDAGGGEILIGGNYQGKTPLSIFNGRQNLVNAEALVMLAGASLNADAITSGNGGKIIMWSDIGTKAYGTLSARGGALSGNGGFIETSGKRYLDVNGISVDTRAANGAIGQWLLDPTNIYLADSQASATAAGMVGTDSSVQDTGGGIFETNAFVDDSLLLISTLVAALDNTDVTVTTANVNGGGVGNITVVDPIAWSSSQTLTLSADNKIFLNANITAPDGRLQLIAAAPAGGVIDSTTATITSSAGTAGVTSMIDVGRLTLTQGAWYQSASSLPTLNVRNDFQVNASSVFKRVTGGAGTVGSPYQIADVYGLQGITSLQAQEGTGLYYRQMNNIDASSTANWNSGLGWVPLGYSLNGFSARDMDIHYDGQNYVIDRLTINADTSDYNYVNGFGLIQNLTAGGSVSNLGLTNVDFVLYNSGNIGVTGAGNYAVMVGNSSGTITNSYATGSFTLLGNAAVYIGGLTGQNNGTISNSYNAVDVTAASASAVGGIAGASFGGTITNVYNIGAISANGNIVPSHSSGGVGGLVGELLNTTVSNSYSSGSISAAAQGSGVVGVHAGGASFSNLYYDSTVYPGTNSSGIGTGLTTAQSMQSGNYGFAITQIDPSAGAGSATWYQLNGSTRPILGMEYNTTIQNAHQLQLMNKDAGAAAASYTLGQNVTMNGTSSASDIWAGLGGSLVIRTLNGNGNSLNLTAANLTFANTLSGLSSLSATSSGGITFGNSTALGITTTGAQNYNSASTIANDTTLTSSGGAITFGSTVDGAGALTVNNSAGALTFTGTVGNTTPLSSLSVSGQTAVNGGLIRTTGNQIYSGGVTLGSNAAFVMTNTGQMTVTGINAPGRTLTLTGGSGGTTFTVGGALSANNITVQGSGGTNALTVSTTDAQNWTVSTPNAGSLANLAGVSSFGFSGIQSITGGSGNANTFNFTGTGQMDSITGGTGIGTNTLNYSGYQGSIVAQLTSDSSGSVSYNSGLVNAFSQIGNLIADNASTLMLKPSANNAVTITDAFIGYVNDPLNFSGFNTIIGQAGNTVSFTVPYTTTSTGVIINGQSMVLTGLTLPAPPAPPAPTTPPNTTINAIVGANNAALGSSTSSSPAASSSQTSSSSSSSSSAAAADSGDSSSSTTTTSEDVFAPAGFIVNENVTEMSSAVKVDDQINQPLKLGCVQ